MQRIMNDKKQGKMDYKLQGASVNEIEGSEEKIFICYMYDIKVTSQNIQGWVEGHAIE